jgi:formylglycine-generating enzyme
MQRAFKALHPFAALGALLGLLCVLPAAAQPIPAAIDWQTIGGVSIARTETTIGQFRRFVRATALVTRAEQQGGGEVFEAGWTRKPGWTWQTPFGAGGTPSDDEPAVHVTFVRGRTYRYPTGERPEGAQCLDDCGAEAARRAVNHGATLTRGVGHARAGTTAAGVNGLFDMGANAWEWVDEPRGATGNSERRTRGGSWWYGAAQMRADHLQGKPAGTAVVYIGFRCVRPD